MSNQRIVSLLPAATEIVCALGMGERLAGRSHECDYPVEIRHVPMLTSARVDARAGGAEIDRQMKEFAKTGALIYQLDTAKLKELRPGLILTQAQCAVCAISLAEVERAAREIPGPPQIVTLSPQRLADIWDNIRAVGEAMEIPERGRELLRSLKNRVVDIIQKTCLLKNHPSVACIEWIDPLMAAGNWVPELVKLAGGENVAGKAGEHSPWMNRETLAQQNPDIIIAMPCGFDLARTRAEMSALVRLPGWAKLRAVKKGRVYLTDGSQYFNRPGPRIVESLEILAEIIHPELFNFDHRGKGWEPL